jgi:hypothetical protein
VTGDAGGPNTFTGSTIGNVASGGTSDAMNGDVAEVAIVSGIIDPADLARYMNYASQRYGIALS